jgi:hypothetical protein
LAFQSSSLFEVGPGKRPAGRLIHHFGKTKYKSSVDTAELILPESVEEVSSGQAAHAGLGV